MKEKDNKTESFEAFGLDPRLVSAIAKMGWETPTKIQAQVIKAAQEGKDVIGTSRTGSGKTAAYLIPVISKLLASLDSVESKDSVMAIVLVPTKELSAQVYDQVQKLLMYASKEVKCVNLIDQAVAFADMNIIVSTPSKLASELSSGHVKVTSDFQSLTIDEADMILSFGYEDDLKKITTFLPSVFQSFLLSATYIPEIDALKQLFLRNPQTIQLEDEHDASFNLVQYWAECKEADKFLLTYFILKLKLITGKCLLFVRDIDRCYQLKLFLEQFGIKSCVLNSELPFNSRYHLVQQFNHGVYEYLIASDEATLAHKQSDEKKEDEKEGTIKKDKDYGVSRGIDFQNVGAVINFDFPIHPKAYTHRVGRTARGDNSGTAFSFVTDSDNKVFKKVEYKQKAKKKEISKYEFDMSQVESFRYRCDDALKQVKKNSIKEARLKDVKQEILHSTKLKAHFKAKPSDLHVLRHDTALHTKRVQEHLKHVPDYLLPEKARTAVKINSIEVTYNRLNKRRNPPGSKKKKGPGKRKQKNPLKNIRAKKRTKSS